MPSPETARPSGCGGRSAAASRTPRRLRTTRCTTRARARGSSRTTRRSRAARSRCTPTRPCRTTGFRRRRWQALATTSVVSQYRWVNFVPVASSFTGTTTEHFEVGLHASTSPCRTASASVRRRTSSNRRPIRRSSRRIVLAGRRGAPVRHVGRRERHHRLHQQRLRRPAQRSTWGQLKTIYRCWQRRRRPPGNSAGPRGLTVRGARSRFAPEAPHASPARPRRAVRRHPILRPPDHARLARRQSARRRMDPRRSECRPSTRSRRHYLPAFRFAFAEHSREVEAIAATRPRRRSRTRSSRSTRPARCSTA